MSTPLWTAQEAADATGGSVVGDWDVTGVSIDTRELSAGDLFVALKNQRDGHEFVPQALEKGAAAALVSDVGVEGPKLLVDDTLKGLEKLGLAARARSRAVHAAVTGSVGKTSVKEMVAQIFRSQGPAHCNVRSFNNHWGVPLTLARMPRETVRAIFEIGMNTPGEIAPRSNMVRPQIAAITKIATAHLEGLGGLDAVADEKSDIFSGLTPDGVAILPREDRFYDYMKARAFDLQPHTQLLSFGGADSGADARLVSFSDDGEVSTGVAEILGEQVRFSLRAVGDHWGMNAVLAILIGRLSGMTAGEAALGLAGFYPPSGRGGAQKLNLPDVGEITLLDDAYNANPESMRAALSALGKRKGRKIAILGEMLELGEGAEQLHAELAEPIRAANVSEVFLAGQGMRSLESVLANNKNEPGVCWTSTAEELNLLVNKSLKSGDCVLIKGSNASGIAKVGSALKALSEKTLEDAMNNTQTSTGGA